MTWGSARKEGPTGRCRGSVQRLSLGARRGSRSRGVVELGTPWQQNLGAEDEVEQKAGRLRAPLGADEDGGGHEEKTGAAERA